MSFQFPIKQNVARFKVLSITEFLWPDSYSYWKKYITQIKSNDSQRGSFKTKLSWNLPYPELRHWSINIFCRFSTFKPHFMTSFYKKKSQKKTWKLEYLPKSRSKVSLIEFSYSNFDHSQWLHFYKIRKRSLIYWAFKWRKMDKTKV